MKKALNKDIIRTIWKEKKRFISIMLITTLGVTVMTGLAAGCRDLRISADTFFDEQKLFDVSIQSTLGMTEGDIEALLGLEGVESAEGTFSEVVHTKKDDVNKTAEVKVLHKEGMNLPYVIEGTLPQNADEIAVTQNYITEMGKQIGDTVVIEEILQEAESDKGKDEKEEEESDKVTDEEFGNLWKDELDTDFEEEETPNFLCTDFTITGVVIDVTDINNAEGSVAFRATPNADYTFFVMPEAVDSDIYTTVYLRLEGAEALSCYSLAYERKTADLISVIEEEIKEQRQQARYDEVTGEAYEKIGDAKQELDDILADAEQKLEDAETEIADGWSELESGRKELKEKTEEAAVKIADARTEIADGYVKLEDAEKKLLTAKQEVEAGAQKLQEGMQELIAQEESAKKQLEEAQSALDTKKAANNTQKQQLSGQLAQIKTLFGAEWSAEVQTAWDTLVVSAETVLLPIIQKQAESGQPPAGSDAELMKQIMELLKQNPEYQAAQTEFITKITGAVMSLQSNLSAQKTMLETTQTDVKGKIADLETDIQNLETEIQSLETEIQNLETEIQNLETEIQDLETEIENLENKLNDSALSEADKEGIRQEITEKQTVLQEKQTELQEKQTALGDRKIVLQEKQTALQQAQMQKESLDTEVAELDIQIAKVSIAIDSLQSPNLIPDLITLAVGNAQVLATETVLNAAQDTLDTKKAEAEEQFHKAWEEIDAGAADIAQGRAKIAEGEAEIEENRKSLNDALTEVEENEKKLQKEIADAKADLSDGETELLDGESKLAENKITYEEEKENAFEKIEEAEDKIADIDMTQWYVQDRTSLSGFVNVKSDAECIESLAGVFAAVFFVVAILISLTTVTRMVEEERGLIGTYKALGFMDKEIRKKYIYYALTASGCGALLGALGGFVILPQILFVFFDVMYLLPHYYLRLDLLSGAVSAFLFIVGITGAAFMACYAELKYMPAQLMRPKAPKMGSRVFLEYITPVWKRFSFLNKVTARNLFRYKKRFFMTVLGIMGCTALLVFGFAIKDSVSELMPLQYERVYQYDLLAAASPEDNEKLIQYMENKEEIESYLNIQVETVKLKNAEGGSEKVQMMVFPNGEYIRDYLTLCDTHLNPLTLGDEGIYLTENAAIILGLEKEDNVLIQKLNLEQEETKVAGLVKNYLGNNVYLTKKAYEKNFGEYEPNGILANVNDLCRDPIAFAETLSEEDWILSAISTQELKEGFSAAFTLINIVVYVVLIFAAGLAFVVLFTLANVNISERIRELATIKVLGFFDGEVHAYVNKETLVLSIMGILLGMPLGGVMSRALTSILDMPSIYFAVTIYPKSYVFASGLALIFALSVQLITNRILDAISPAEALKSVE